MLFLLKKIMCYKKLKSTVLVIGFLLLTNFTFAQTYHKFSLGLGAGPNYPYTDVYKGKISYTTYGSLDYSITPFITLGLEAQNGEIEGGSINTDPYNRQYKNRYSSINANVKFMLGEVVDYDKSSFLYAFKGFYAGIGIGAINNKIVDIVRYRPSFSNDPGYGPFPGKDKSLHLAIPINLGINFFLNDNNDVIRYVINVNAQSNYIVGEGLDGYNDSPDKFRNEESDMYNAYTIGFKYFFGNTKIYRKTL